MEKINLTDLLNEVQQVRIMGGERSESVLSIVWVRGRQQS